MKYNFFSTFTPVLGRFFTDPDPDFSGSDRTDPDPDSGKKSDPDPEKNGSETLVYRKKTWQFLWLKYPIEALDWQTKAFSHSLWLDFAEIFILKVQILKSGVKL